MENHDIKEVRNRLDNAASILYRVLDEQFGSFKKAPDDHALLKAADEITNALLCLPEVEEDDQDEAA
jgi:hypothetical protein